MITYIENGYGLHEAIKFAGYFIGNINGTWQAFQNGQQSAAIDSAVQAIINSYTPLSDPMVPNIGAVATAATNQTLAQIKVAAIQSVEAIGLGKIQAIFPAILDFNALQFYAQFWLSIASAARSPTASFTQVINIYNAGATAVAAINTATTAAGVAAVVPAWP